MKQLPVIFLLFFITNLCNATENISWPPSSDKPRIEFLKTISDAADLNIDKSFFGKFTDFIFGEDPIGLARPFGIFVKNTNVLYVTDTVNNSLFIFDKKSQELKVIKGTKKLNFKSPIDVKIDDKDNIYVTDSLLGKIFLFNNEGEFVKIFADNFKLERPTGLAIDTINEKLYVTDTEKHTIEVFSLKGDHLDTIGKYGRDHGEFNKPTFITVDKNGNLYVTDSLNHRIQIFDNTGIFKFTFGERGKSAGTFANPRGIAVDNQGNIYVSDTLFNNIQIFNKKGQLLLVFGSEGMGKGEFSLPIGITINQDGDLYIADSYNMRVQYFKKHTYDDDL